VTQGKTIQVSTRITQEDAEFLASLVREDATTPSDKLRALITEAREREENRGDYTGSLRQVKRLVGPAVERVLQVENSGLPHSEVVTPMIEWLSETLAFVLSQIPGRDEPPTSGNSAARALESGLADRALQLVGQILRLGVTEHAQCYDPKAISRRLKPILEIARVVDAAQGEKAKP
jgi:hypothetical protein